MAVLITTEKVVKIIKPVDSMTFNLEEIHQLLGGWPDPFKVGPVWVMQKEEATEEDALNNAASDFFEVPLRGTVLVVPPQQLPLEWELMEEEDKMFSAEMVDSGFLLSLKTSIELTKMREDQPPLSGHLGDMQSPIDFFTQKYMPQKEMYVYNPDADTPLNPDIRKFLSNSYEFITKSPMQFKQGVILEDDDVIVRTPPENRQTVLGIMMNMFLENEEYEKCAEIQRLEKLTI